MASSSTSESAGPQGASGTEGGGGNGNESTSSSKPKEDGENATIWFNPKWKMDLLIKQHARFCLRLLHKLPASCEELEAQRMTILQFSVTSLDILNQVHLINDDQRGKIVEWVYRLQICDVEPSVRCGMQGSTPAFLLGGHSEAKLPHKIAASHVATTYAALVTLLTLGDNLSRLNKRKILEGLAQLQNCDGSFRAGYGCDESDMRFIYCAVCICYILNDFSTINVPRLIHFIKRSFTYEGSFTSGHAAEGHAGHTFCAVASLALMNKLDDTLDSEEVGRLLRWCVSRQGQMGGFTGRTNKAEDTCYSYWVGGTLALLDKLSLISCDKNVDFVLGNQNPLSGGIGKVDGEFVDPLHTFLGLAGLSLVKYDGLNVIDPKLTMSSNATERLYDLHQQWSVPTPTSS